MLDALAILREIMLKSIITNLIASLYIVDVSEYSLEPDIKDGRFRVNPIAHMCNLTGHKSFSYVLKMHQDYMRV
jgi:hypothetical protein